MRQSIRKRETEGFMRRQALLSVLLLFLVACPLGVLGASPNKEAGGMRGKPSCMECHPDISAVLSSSHPKVAGKTIDSCTSCHRAGKEHDGYSVRLHRAHGDPARNVACTVCHAWSPGKSFFLPATRISIGAPSKDDMQIVRKAFATWASGSYLAALHQKGNIGCSQCHGKQLPKPDDTVENGVCCNCHGSYEDLAKRTMPIDFKDRNPHNSHYGQIACTVCHNAHTPSKVLCLDCHSNFKMTIPGGR
jgi:hypothetical protein